MSRECYNHRLIFVGKRHGLATLFCSLACLPNIGQAQTDNLGVDGEYGEFHVTGQLTEGACRLEMNSAFQQIELGNITTDKLAHVGDEGEPVSIQLRLRDCLRTASGYLNNQTGNFAWSANQPVMAVAFLAPEDENSPSLVRVNGSSISGVGLRLMDEHYRPVQLGSWTRPHFVAPGQDEMTFYVVPERTPAPLMAGNYAATINFRLNYE